MEWYWYVAINIVVFSLATLYQRMILKDSRDPVVIYVVNGLVAGLFLLGVGFYQGFNFPDLKDISLNLILMAVLIGTGNILIFRGLKKVEASEYTVLFSTRAIWSVLAAIVFLHESFSGKQIIGAALIILSVFVVSWKKKSFRLNEGEMLTLAAAFFVGFAFINDTYLLNKVDLFFYMPLVFALPAIFAMVVNYKRFLKPGNLLTPMETVKVSVLSLLFAISATSTFTAYEKGHNAAQIAILNQTSTILIVVLGIIFLRERNHLYLKILGGIISLVGVYLVR
jgi:drug/metabolite transporter (DMT)-like permease